MASVMDVRDLSEERIDFLVERIKAQLLAFPDVPVGMLHPRLTPKYEGWRAVLDQLIVDRRVVQIYREVDGSAIRCLRWDEEREAELAAERE